MADVQMEIRILQGRGYLTSDLKLTMTGRNLIALLANRFNAHRSKRKKEKILTGDDIQYIEKYRALFPAGLLPTGTPSRQTVRELQQKFTWFFSKYKDYKWDLILGATAAYVDDFESRGFEFMRSSANFIVKTESMTKMAVSDLATWCELYRDHWK